MSELGTQLQQLIDRWRSRGIPIRPGVDPTDIADFETRWRVTIPSDMQEYFQTVDGMGEHYDEEDFCRFWPLKDVKAVHEYFPELARCLPRAAGYFFFFDHSVDLFLYAVQLDSMNLPAASIALIYPQLPTPALDVRFHSFTEFIATYVADSWKVF